MVIPSLLYGSEFWPLVTQLDSQNEKAELRFLKAIAGYGSTGHIRHETDNK